VNGGGLNLLQKATPRNNFVRPTRFDDAIFAAFHAWDFVLQ
jgi:hypothetical protein